MAYKIRVSVTFDVPDRLHAVELINSDGFKKLAGQAVTSVAATSVDAEMNPRWRDIGFMTTVHNHMSYEGQRCDECYSHARDEINEDTE